MKILLLVALIAVSYFNCEKIHLELPCYNACFAQRIDQECVNFSGSVDDIGQQIANNTYKEDCYSRSYLYCLQKNLGFGNDDGTVNVEEYTKFFGVQVNDRLKNIFKNCNKEINKTHRNKYWIAAHVYKCATKSINVTTDYTKIRC